MVAEVFLFPMSFAQQRLWFLDQLEPGSAAYNVPGAVRLRGRLDIPALEHSLNEIIRRHEALRTGFNMLDGRPVQVITPVLEIALAVTSLEDVAESEREEWAQKLVMAQSQQPFDLKQAPLLRASLLRLAEDDHIFLLTMHHIISDGWSIGVMLAELTALYVAYLEGRSSPLPELPIQYADFAVWQREWLQGEVLEEQLAYWKEQLGGELPGLQLPTDYARPSATTYEGAYYPFSIPQALTDSLKALSQQAGVTLFMTMLAGFKTLLYRYTGQEDIIVGTPIANRNRSETEGLIGFFANTLAVRTDLSGDPSFLDLLKRIQQVMVGAYAHQDLPFEKIVEELQPERSVSSNPLFQVVFLLLDSLPSSVSLPGLTFEPWSLDWKSVKFDLEFHISEAAGGLTCSIAYSTDLFEEATISRLATHYLTLLEAIVAEPESRISRLPLLTSEERKQLLAQNTTAASGAVPDITLVYEVPEARAEVLISFQADSPQMPAKASDIRVQAEESLIEGRPLAPAVVLVLDDVGQLVPVGVSGEVCIGGPALEGAHSFQIEASAQSLEGLSATAFDGRPRFISNPHDEISGSQLLCTGDRGRWLADGRLRIEGRPGVAARIDGHRVIFADVEAALLQHTSIEECVVLTRRMSQGLRLAAYVVCGNSLDKGELKEWLSERLPPFMLPEVYVEMKRLPLTQSGAVDEAALTALVLTDEQQLLELEERLLEVEEVREVAVVEQEVEDEQLLLHLLDIVAEPKDETDNETDSEAPTLSQPQSAGSNLKSSTATAVENNDETKAEARPALSDGGPIELDDTLPKTLAEMLYRAAQSSSHGVTYLSGRATGEQTYSQLLYEAKSLSGFLSSIEGAEAGHPVILQLEDNRQFLSAFWGCVLAGMVPVPLSTAVSYEQESNATRMLENVWQMLDRALVLTDRSREAQIREVLARQSDDDTAVKVVAIEEAGEAATEYEDVYAAADRAGADDLALLLFTSGSTGKPKGVMLSHRNLISHAVANIELSSYTSDDVSLNWMPLTHVGGIVMFHLRDVFIGCRQVHVPTSEILGEPLRWLDLMDEYGATTTWAPNFAYALINEELERLNSEGRSRKWDLSRMRYIINGGEAVNAATGRKFLQMLAEYGLPATSMHPAYGMSETSSAITFSNSFSLESIADSDKFVSVGVPYAGVMLRIVDEKGRVTEERSTGYLQVKGTTITSGYYRNPALNAEVFSDGWLNTGDLAFISEGSLTLTGREKDVIIINGINYYSHEIEAVVEEIDGVTTSYTAACAIRKPQSDTDGVAIFFSSELKEPERQIKQINEIRQKVGQKFGVRPDYVLPVEKTEIPKTSIGKIQRTQLQQRFEAGHFASLLKKLDLAFESANTLPDWFYRQVWRPRRAIHTARSLAPATTLLFLDERGLGAHLSASLSQSGSNCISVVAGSDFRRESPLSYQLNPHKGEHYQELLKALAADGLLPQQVLHLWAYDAPQGDDLNGLLAAQERGFNSVFQLARALADAVNKGAEAKEESVPASAEQSANASLRLTVITADAQPSRHGTMRSYQHAALPGLLKSMRSEFPWLECRHLDLESGSPETGAAQVLTELKLDKGETEVSYRDGVRLVPRLRKVQMLKEERQSLPFRRGGLYLMTGGLGGVGSYLARYLIQRYGVKLLLTGRTPLAAADTGSTTSTETSGVESSKESQRLQRLRAVESAGPDSCLYRAVDVCDLEGLRQAVREAEQHWREPLGGVLHLAGEENLARHWREINEHWITAQSMESIASAIRAKVEGTWKLYELLRGHEGAFFVGFSSVNSLFGAASFAAYSAANSFLDGYVQYQQERGAVPSWCFNWTMWEEMGMSEGAPAFTREASRSLGYSIMGTEQGVQSLLAGLSLRPTRIVVGLDTGQGQARRMVENATPPSRKLVAYYTCATNESLNSRLQDLLSSTGLIRQHNDCEFVQVQEMPRTQSGEIDRGKLTLLGQRKGRARTGQDAPRTDVEIQLAEIWKRLLGIKQLGIHDSFFELGGHSLLAIQLISQVNKSFKIELSLAQLFEAPTIASLAQLLVRVEAEPGQVEAVARLRKQLDAMSAEEIKAALLARQGARV